ncbi:hypothetical protein [Epilithonimonas caeni]|uniref:hypothetical protein n=1 Tax=Epilithonimonas caeni TaxID=365343 RepID=UPI00040523E5|nr:hypothetical protein [Epilithonimonas caeni]
MNYLNLLSNFWEANQKLKIGASAAVIYIFLLHKWNEKQLEDFTLSDIEISKKLRLSINTIKSTKEVLRNIGLIEYQTQNGLPCCYKIVTNEIIFEKENNSKQKVTEKKKQTTSKLSKTSTLKNITSLDSTSVGKNEKPIKLIDIPAQSEINSDSPEKHVSLENPSFDEFLSFAKTIKNYMPDLDSSIETKYISWLNNQWRNDSNRPITDWKKTLKNIMPYIINSEKYSEKQEIIPQTINRPQIKI